MNIDILINHYKENSDLIDRMLSSIGNQKGIRAEDNVNVIVCSDGTKIDASIYDKRYGIPIQFIEKEHRGVCPTRNTLLDISDAEYVIFADIDDYFCSDIGLNRIIEAAHKTNADIISANYYVEYPDGHTYMVEKRDTLRIHAKAFKRSYLIENDIRFPDEEISGDMYMTYLAIHLAERIAWLDDMSYVWAYNKESVTRKDQNETVAITYPQVVRCYRLLMETLFDRDRYDLSNRLLPSLMAMMYVDKFDNYRGATNKEAVKKADASVLDFIRIYKKYFSMLPSDLIKEKYSQYIVTHKCKNTGSFEDFINWVKEQGNKV